MRQRFRAFGLGAGGGATAAAFPLATSVPQSVAFLMASPSFDADSTSHTFERFAAHSARENPRSTASSFRYMQ